MSSCVKRGEEKPRNTQRGNPAWGRSGKAVSMWRHEPPSVPVQWVSTKCPLSMGRQHGKCPCEKKWRAEPWWGHREWEVSVCRFNEKACLCEDIMRSFCSHEDTRKTGRLFPSKRRNFRRCETHHTLDHCLLDSSSMKTKWYIAEHSSKLEEAAFMLALLHTSILAYFQDKPFYLQHTRIACQYLILGICPSFLLSNTISIENIKFSLVFCPTNSQDFSKKLCLYFI